MNTHDKIARNIILKESLKDGLIFCASYLHEGKTIRKNYSASCYGIKGAFHNALTDVVLSMVVVKMDNINKDYIIQRVFRRFASTILNSKSDIHSFTDFEMKIK
jgi:hypothetical protein